MARALNIQAEGQAVIINQDSPRESPKWTRLQSPSATPQTAAHAHTPNDNSKSPPICLITRWQAGESICPISLLTMMPGRNPLQEPMPQWCRQGSNPPANCLPLYTVKLSHWKKRTNSWRDSWMGNLWIRALILSIKGFLRMSLRMRVLPKSYAITSVRIRRPQRSTVKTTLT